MAFALALVPAVLFATQQLLMTACRAGERRLNVGVLVGAGAASVLASPFAAGRWSTTALVLGVVAGLAWSTGQILIVRALRAWGVSRAMPVIAGGQIVINAAAGVLLLGEWASPTALAAGCAALVAVIAGAWACSWTRAGDPVGGQAAASCGTEAAGAGGERVGETSSGERVGEASSGERAGRSGLLACLGCAVLYGIYPPMLQLGGVSAGDALGPMGVGLLCGAVLVAVVLPRQEPVAGDGLLVPVVAGGVWAGGNVALLMAAATIGVATAMPLSQLSFALSSLGGIVILGERRRGAEAVATGVGLALAVIGVVLLGVASAR